MRVDRVLLVAVAICLAIGLASADTKIVEKHHSDAFEVMGQKQPATDEEVTKWLAADKMRVDRGDTTVIARLDENKLYIVSHKDKRVLKADLPVTLESIAGDMAAMIKPMMEKMKVTADVTPTDERKSIGDWPARRYDVKASSEMMEMEMELWVTEDAPIDASAAMDTQAVMWGLQPGMKDLVEEMKKIKGYPIQQTVTVKAAGTARKQTHKVLSIEEKSAPAGAYDPPADYTVKPLTLQEMQGMQM